MAETLMLSPIDSVNSHSDSAITSRSSVASRSQNAAVNDRGATADSIRSKPARTDSLKASQPAHKKLSTLEAQRVMAVLTSAIRRAELASMFARLAEMSGFGGELGRLLERNGVLIENYNELCGVRPVIIEENGTSSRGASRNSTASRQRDAESGPAEESQGDLPNHNKSALEGALSDSCRDALRLFGHNPSASDAALDLSRTSGPLRSQAAEQMIQQLKELREFLMSRLLVTPVEDVEKSRYLREVREKEKYNAKIVGKLMAELQTVEQLRDEDISRLNEVIRKLQADLHQVELKAEEAFQITRTESERQQAADQKNSDGKLGKLQQDLALARTQYHTLLSQHRDSEHALRKRKFQIETEIENWIQKYDGDMGERQDEYEKIDEVYTAEKSQLNELEERFGALELEYRRIMDERRVARESREAAERELQMCVRAALTIQSFWRSFKVRKAIKAKKKRGGGAGRVAATGGGQKKIKK